MSYRIQTTINGKTWKNLQFAGPFDSLEAAWDRCRTYDPDGLLMPDVRVVDHDGKAMPRPTA